jgi:hypothetical protein
VRTGGSALKWSYTKLLRLYTGSLDAKAAFIDGNIGHELGVRWEGVGVCVGNVGEQAGSHGAE